MITTTKTVLTKDPTGKTFYNYSSLKPPNHLKATLALIFIGCT
jgi:proline racemase